jgi:hypothetical protein
MGRFSPTVLPDYPIGDQDTGQALAKALAAHQEMGVRLQAAADAHITARTGAIAQGYDPRAYNPNAGAGGGTATAAPPAAPGDALAAATPPPAARRVVGGDRWAGPATTNAQPGAALSSAMAAPPPSPARRSSKTPDASTSGPGGAMTPGAFDPIHGQFTTGAGIPPHLVNTDPQSHIATFGVAGADRALAGPAAPGAALDAAMSRAQGGGGPVPIDPNHPELGSVDLGRSAGYERALAAAEGRLLGIQYQVLGRQGVAETGAAARTGAATITAGGRETVEGMRERAPVKETWKETKVMLDGKPATILMSNLGHAHDVAGNDLADRDIAPYVAPPKPATPRAPNPNAPTAEERALAREQRAAEAFVNSQRSIYARDQIDPATGILKTKGMDPAAAEQKAQEDARASGRFPHVYPKRAAAPNPFQQDIPNPFTPTAAAAPAPAPVAQSTPKAAGGPAAPKESITAAERDALKAAGFSDKEIADKYTVKAP